MPMADDRPNSADEYKPILPEGSPVGARIDVNDPRFKAAQTRAFEACLTQRQFTDLILCQSADARHRRRTQQLRRPRNESRRHPDIRLLAAVEFGGPVLIFEGHFPKLFGAAFIRSRTRIMSAETRQIGQIGQFSQGRHAALPLPFKAGAR